MLKKILYILISLIVGAIVVFTTCYISFTDIYKDICKSAVKDGDYSLAESFFYDYTVKDDNKFYAKNYNSTRIEVFPAVINNTYFKIDEYNNVTQDYLAYDDVIAISIFNLPDSFATSDKVSKNGRVELKLSNGGNYTVYFDNTSSDPASANYNLNFYKYIDQYSQLTIYITYDDFILNGNDVDTSFSSMNIYDGNSVLFTKIDFFDYPSFSNVIHKKFYTSIHEYKEFVKENRSVTVVNVEKQNELKANVTNVYENNKNIIVAKPNRSIVFSTNTFVLRLSIVVAAFLAIDIVLGIQLLRYSKKHYQGNNKEKKKSVKH